jgi:uncharacterized protein YcfJ
MALDTQLTQIQSAVISSNTVLTGITTVSTLNATNAVVSGIVTASLVGNVTGNVTGNTTGTHIGNVTGDTTGSHIGNVTGDTTGSHIGNVTATTITASDSITLTTKPFFRNIPTIAADYTVTTNYNEMSIGPITINNGITVTVNSGATWTVV